MAWDSKHIEEPSNKFLEQGATETKSGDVTWEANHIQTDAIQIIDPGVGKERVVRSFFFKAVPQLQGQPKPTKLQIIESYKRFIEQMIWSDGLTPVMHAPVQLYTRKEVGKFKSLRAKFLEEKADFVIMVLCEASGINTILEKPRIAQ